MYDIRKFLQGGREVEKDEYKHDFTYFTAKIDITQTVMNSCLVSIWLGHWMSIHFEIFLSVHGMQL